MNRTENKFSFPNALKTIIEECNTIYEKNYTGKEVNKFYVSVRVIVETTLQMILYRSNPKIDPSREMLSKLIIHVSIIPEFNKYFNNFLYKVKGLGNIDAHSINYNKQFKIFRLELHSYLEWFFDSLLKENIPVILTNWYNENENNSEVISKDITETEHISPDGHTVLNELIQEYRLADQKLSNLISERNIIEEELSVERKKDATRNVADFENKNHFLSLTERRQKLEQEVAEWFVDDETNPLKPDLERKVQIDESEELFVSDELWDDMVFCVKSIRIPEDLSGPSYQEVLIEGIDEIYAKLKGLTGKERKESFQKILKVSYWIE